MTKRTSINPPPEDTPDDAPSDAVKVEFAKRLKKACDQRGWNQSELARRAQIQLGEGRKMGRDVISSYARAKALPGPAYLNALCKALHMKPDELLPSRGVRSAGSSSSGFYMRQMVDGNVWLTINQAFPPRVAANIVALVLGGESKS